MELQSILSFLVITEKFKLADLDARDQLYDKRRKIDTIDQLNPVFKYIDDEYLASQKEAEENEDKNPVKKYSEIRPIYRIYFDFTDGKYRDPRADKYTNSKRGTLDMIDVQIRVQFTEPSQDTLGVNKHRRFLRYGQLQFLVIAKFDKAMIKKEIVEYSDRRPLFEAFKIAQYCANKYEGSDGIKILKDIDKKEDGTENMPGPTKRLLQAYEDNPPNQFADLGKDKYVDIFNHLFPGAGTPYERIVQEVKTLNTGVARIVNLRFAELERRTVDPIRITNPTYGLAVTIPFTFEQTR